MELRSLRENLDAIGIFIATTRLSLHIEYLPPRR